MLPHRSEGELYEKNETEICGVEYLVGADCFGGYSVWRTYGITG